MRKLKNWLVVGIVIAVSLAAGYALLIRFPNLLFSSHIETPNLTLYCDQSLPVDASQKTLALVRTKLASSPLFSSADHFDVFICTKNWRQRIFFFTHPGAGGVNFYPITSNTFVINADIIANRIITASGKPDIFGRSLDHFITHEITHSLTGRRIGPLSFQTLPTWIKEGYAEYVAWTGEIDTDQAINSFLADDPIMSMPKLAPYRRYHVLVAYLLEREGWSVENLLSTRLDQSAIETLLKNHRPNFSTMK